MCRDIINRFGIRENKGVYLDGLGKPIIYREGVGLPIPKIILT